MARCSQCDHDLVAQPPKSTKSHKHRGQTVLRGKSTGAVFCSNGRCRYSRRPHDTPPKPNLGFAKADD
jgi:hypothetical protein